MIARDGNVYVGVGAALVAFGHALPGASRDGARPSRATSRQTLSAARSRARRGLLRPRGRRDNLRRRAGQRSRPPFAKVSSSNGAKGPAFDREATYYIADSRVVRAFSADGSVKWTLDVPNFIASGIGLADRTLYFGTTFNGGQPAVYAVGP